jgi:hypothetical protein
MEMAFPFVEVIDPQGKVVASVVGEDGIPTVPNDM